MSAVVEGESRAAKLAAAKRAIAALGLAAGLPRCRHYRWRLDPAGVRRWNRMVARRRGVVPYCTCTDPRDPDPDCAHVTWQAADVLELADGTVLVDTEDVARVPELRFAPVRRLTEAESEAAVIVASVRDETRAARAALEPAPAPAGGPVR